MTDPRFRSRLRSSLMDRYQPAWMAHAACRGKQPNGMLWGSAFLDELAEVPEDQEYAWPEKVRDVLATCAGCPVRRQCLEYAYEVEPVRWLLQWTNEQGERVDEESGEVPEFSSIEFLLQRSERVRRFGVYGGLPGRMRERFAPHADRLERSERWFKAYCRDRRLLLADQKESVA